jgi:hypothetical protein
MNIFCQLTLIVIIGSLTSLIKQRISVPELKSEKWKNYCIILTSTCSVISMFAMTFLGEQTMSLSRNIGLVDNILFLLFMTASFSYCLLSFDLLEKLNIREIPKDCYCILFKRYLITLMAVQLFCCI